MHDHIVPGLRGRGRRSRSAQFHRVAHAQPRLLPHGRRAPAGRQRPDHYPVLWLGKTTLARSLRAPAAARRRPVRRRGRQGPRASRRPPEPRPRRSDARQRRRRRPRPSRQGLDGSQGAPGEGAGPPCPRREAPPYGDLVARLPDHAAFVDLYRYQESGHAARKWGGGQYVAFLLRKGRPVRRAVLGDAAPSKRTWFSGGTTSAKAFGATPPTD